MINFGHILFPTDFSARSVAAVPSVRSMVERFGSELTVLHVVDLPPVTGIAPPEVSAWATLIGADRLREQGRIALQRFIVQEFSGLPVKMESAEGDPATLIGDYARERAADLIMMPTSGHGPFRRFLIGSVTAKVLHDSAAPVWTGVHSEEIQAHPPGSWKRLLCALDDDPRDLHVLQWAAEFASGQKLEVRLLHAIRGSEECQDNPSFREFLFDVARERIDKLQAEAGTSFEICLRVGNPGRLVHQAAVLYSSDLVLIGRGVIQKTLGRLRSSAYEIIREAPCPVISV